MAFFVNPLRRDVGKEPENAHTRDASRMTLFGHQRDVADRLPEPARAKLRRLRAAAADAHALAQLPYHSMREAHDAALAIDSRIRSLENGASRGHPETIKIVEAERANLEKFRAEAREHSAEHERRKSGSEALALTIRAIEDYVSTLPLTPMVETAPIAPPTLQKNETPAQAVDRLRAKIATLQQDAQATEDAPHHSSVAKARARRQIETLAASGRIDVMPLIEANRDFLLPMTMGEGLIVRGDSGSAHGMLADHVDAVAMMMWLFKDQLLARIEAEIDECADDRSALSPETRAKRRAQIAAQILQTEREEERLIELAADQGVTIMRRPDCDPRAILQLSDAAPAPRD